MKTTRWSNWGCSERKKPGDKRTGSVRDWAKSAIIICAWRDSGKWRSSWSCNDQRVWEPGVVSRASESLPIGWQDVTSFVLLQQALSVVSCRLRPWSQTQKAVLKGLRKGVDSYAWVTSSKQESPNVVRADDLATIQRALFVFFFFFSFFPPNEDCQNSARSRFSSNYWEYERFPEVIHPSGIYMCIHVPYMKAAARRQPQSVRLWRIFSSDD